MRKPGKAVLYSALLFPGAGHFYLKKTISGLVLAGTAAASLYLIFSTVIKGALEISDKIQSGEIPPDFTLISELVSEQVLGSNGGGLDFAGSVLILAWVIGIADSYRIARQSAQQNRDELNKPD